jgi:hypothetical protein
MVWAGCKPQKSGALRNLDRPWEKTRQSRVNGENNIVEWVSREIQWVPAESRNIYMAPINLLSWTSCSESTIDKGHINILEINRSPGSGRVICDSIHTLIISLFSIQNP